MKQQAELSKSLNDLCRICGTVNLRITAPLEFKRHFETELSFSLYFKRLFYLLGLGGHISLGATYTWSYFFLL